MWGLRGVEDRHMHTITYSTYYIYSYKSFFYISLHYITADSIWGPTRCIGARPIIIHATCTYHLQLKNSRRVQAIGS